MPPILRRMRHVVLLLLGLAVIPMNAGCGSKTNQGSVVAVGVANSSNTLDAGHLSILDATFGSFEIGSRKMSIGLGWGPVPPTRVINGHLELDVGLLQGEIQRIEKQLRICVAARPHVLDSVTSAETDLKLFQRPCSLALNGRLAEVNLGGPHLHGWKD